MFDALVNDFPEVPDHRRLCSETYCSLGLVLSNLGKQKEALVADDKALDVFKHLTTDCPNEPNYRMNLAGCLINRATWMRDNGEAAASLEWYGQGIAILQPLVEAEPKLDLARLCLRNGHGGRCLAFGLLKRFAEAVADADAASSLDTGKDRNISRLEAALSRARIGEHVQAVATANELASLKNLDGASLYELARVYAVAFVAAKDNTMLREQYAVQAVEALGKAKAIMLFQDQKRLASFRTEADFDAMRQREDFKRMMQDLPQP